MRGDEIANVNIIPNAGAIRRRIVGAEDIRFRPPPLRSWSRRHLGSEVAPLLDCSVRVGSRNLRNGDRDRLSLRRVNECERNSTMFAID